MKHGHFHLLGIVLITVTLMLPMLAGCATSPTGSSSGDLFFNIVQTILLGVTAAGGYVLIRNA